MTSASPSATTAWCCARSNGGTTWTAGHRDPRLRAGGQRRVPELQGPGGARQRLLGALRGVEQGVDHGRGLAAGADDGGRDRDRRRRDREAGRTPTGSTRRRRAARPRTRAASQQAYNEGIADAFFVPSNPDVAYFVGGAFANVFFTTNGLTSSGVEKPAGGRQRRRRRAGHRRRPRQPAADVVGQPGALRQVDRALHRGRLRDRAARSSWPTAPASSPRTAPMTSTSRAAP